jgi:hypothetical protein
MSEPLRSASSGPGAEGVPTKAVSELAVVLRVLGGVDLLALVAVVMPRGWMAQGHAWAGLGELPTAPIVGYLGRSASFLYALHGATVLFISFDVARYRPLITFLAIIALAHGAVMLGIDLAEGMPLWWTVVEGPGFTATGAVVLSLQVRGRRGPHPGKAPRR